MRPHKRWRSTALRVAAWAGVVTGAAIVTTGCSAAYVRRIARWSTALQAYKVMVYGGPADTTYLGCLNCFESDTESVLDPQGPYGSRGSATSIANPNGSFGSLSSPYSACNLFAADPPIIVDDQGNNYGWLTVDPSRAVDPSADAVQRWISRLCARVR